MIEATGVLTLVSDTKHPTVAVPDVVPGYSDTGELYQNLIRLLGQEVYVLVLPKSEMLQMCKCEHTYAEHLGFSNWERGCDPSIDILQSHVSYAGRHPSDTTYCRCKKFEAKP